MSAERTRIYKIFPEGRAGRARLLRKNLDAKPPPAEAEVKKSPLYKEGDIFGAIRAHPSLSGIGELLRPRQGAANLFPEALREGSRATPPHTPFLAPTLGDSPWALQDPARKKAFEAEKSRQRRNALKTSFLNTGQLALAYLRYIVAGELAGYWAEFGGLGAILTHLASTIELSITKNVKTASRFERARSAAWSHLARARGSLQTIKDELVKINRDRLHQCANDQILGFTDRQKGRRGGGNHPGPNRNPARNRKRSRPQRRNVDRARGPKRRHDHRSRSPRDTEDAKNSKNSFPAVKKEDDQKADLQKGENASGSV